MKGKNLLILAVIAVALIATAVHTSRQNSPVTPAVTGRTLFENLPVNDVARIVVSKAKDSVTLSKTGDGWVCTTKYDYPVNFDRIRATLVAMADMKIGQLIHVNRDQLPEIGMIEPGVDDSGTLIELLSASGDTIASLLIGGHRKGGSDSRGYPEGQFISKDKGNTVYLVADRLNHITEEPKGWIETELLNVSSDDIVKISISTKNTKPLLITRLESGEFTVDGISKKEECDTGKLNSLKSALNYLHLDDIADPSLSDKVTGMDDPIIYQVETKNGQVYNVLIGKPAEKTAVRYIRISATLKDDESDAQDTDEDAETQENDEHAKLKEKIETLNKRFANRTYTLAIYKTDNMVCSRDEIVKPMSKK